VRAGTGVFVRMTVDFLAAAFVEALEVDDWGVDGVDECDRLLAGFDGYRAARNLGFGADIGSECARKLDGRG